MYHHPPFISRVYHELQNVTLNIFPQALISPAWAPSFTFSPAHFGNLHLVLLQLPRGPPALHKYSLQGGESGIPWDDHHHLLAPSPLDNLMHKMRQKKCSGLFCAWKQFFGVLHLLCALKELLHSSSQEERWDMKSKQNIPEVSHSFTQDGFSRKPFHIWVTLAQFKNTQRSEVLLDKNVPQYYFEIPILFREPQVIPMCEARKGG